MEGAKKIKLTKNDSQAAGRHHFIGIDSVDHVDDKVHLNKAASAVFLEWQSGA
jgi:hypothetical protein